MQRLREAFLFCRPPVQRSPKNGAGNSAGVEVKKQLRNFETSSRLLCVKLIENLRRDESYSRKTSIGTRASVLGSSDPRSPHQKLVVGVVMIR